MEHDENWDQFQGKKSTFDENLYTTVLKVDEIPEEVKAKAEILAKEITEESKKKLKTKGKPETYPIRLISLLVLS